MIPESKNFIFWFTGLSGSGKTFLTLKLKNYLEKKKIKKIKVIDGDTFRKNIKNYKYDIQSREKIGFLKADLAKQFYNKGYVVLVSGIAHKKIWRAKLRKILYNCNYSEIYLKCPINECKKRKIYIYQPLKNRQIVGLSGSEFMYEEYKKNDLTIVTSKNSKTSSFKKLIIYLKKKYKI